MHICFSTIDYHQKSQGGGIASYLDAVCPALVALGHEVSIVGPGNIPQDYIDKQGVRIILRPLGSIHWYAYRLKMPSFLYLLIREWEWSRSLFQAIKKLHEEHPIDLIESTESGIWQLVRKRSTLPPLVIRLHGSPYIFSIFSNLKPTLGEKLVHQLELKLLKKVNGISAPSQFQASYYKDLVGKEVKAIPNPIASRFLEYSNHKYINTQYPIILYTGRIEYRKGSLVLLEALGLLLRNYPNTKLIIAGAHHNSISELQWRKKIVETGTADNLQLLGHIHFDKLQQYYHQASVFVMPSYYETFGISVIEAMAHELPVVVSRAGALPELVQSGHNGLTVPSGDAQALAGALKQILQDPIKAKQMGQAGRAMVLENFIPDSVVQQQMYFYKAKTKY